MKEEGLWILFVGDEFELFLKKAISQEEGGVGGGTRLLLLF